MLIPVQNAYISLYFIKIWPFKPCTLTKHVIWISLYPNFPVKTLYFPVRDCSESSVLIIFTDEMKKLQFWRDSNTQSVVWKHMWP